MKKKTIEEKLNTLILDISDIKESIQIASREQIVRLKEQEDTLTEILDELEEGGQDQAKEEE